MEPRCCLISTPSRRSSPRFRVFGRPGRDRPLHLQPGYVKAALGRHVGKRSGHLLVLEGPRGQEVVNRSFTADSYSADPVVDLVPGDYMMTVDGSGDATGPYAFRLLDLAAAPGIPPARR